MTLIIKDLDISASTSNSIFAGSNFRKDSKIHISSKNPEVFKEFKKQYDISIKKQRNEIS
jgi:hypothetical protein